MLDAPATPVVAIVHQDQSVSAVLCALLEDEGYRCLPTLLPTPRHDDAELADLLDQQGATVVIYDVAPPYDVNWARLQRLRARNGGQAPTFVVVTTDRSLLEALRPAADGVAVLAEPFALDELVAAVQRAAEELRQRTRARHFQA